MLYVCLCESLRIEARSSLYVGCSDNTGPGQSRAGWGPSAPGERVRRIGWMKQGREGPVWSKRALRSVWHAYPSIFWRWGGLIVSYSGFSPKMWYSINFSRTKCLDNVVLNFAMSFWISLAYLDCLASHPRRRTLAFITQTIYYSSWWLSTPISLEEAKPPSRVAVKTYMWRR